MATSQGPDGPSATAQRPWSSGAPSRCPMRRGTVMTEVGRTLAPEPVASLQEYRDGGGGRALDIAQRMGGERLIDVVDESGLRARGGAGIPCGPKWRTVRSYGMGAAVAPSMVVNAAEGEPGSFKDRAILGRNPYLVLEGALLAAGAIGAEDVIFALKAKYVDVVGRVREAIDEARGAGWLEGVSVEVFEGPDEYLYGEETAMLEAIDGRPPFPRIAPPYRRGVHEVVDRVAGPEHLTASAAHIELAGPGDTAVGSPTLVNNVETLANVPGIVVEGPAWFRSIGTAESSGIAGLHRHGRHPAPRCRRGRDGHAAARGHRAHRRRTEPRPGDQGRAGRRRYPPADRGPARHAGQQRRPAGRRRDAGRRRVHRVRRPQRHRRRRRRGGSVPRRRVVRPVCAVQGGRLGAGRPVRTGPTLRGG